MKYIEITILVLLIIGIACIMFFYNPSYLEVKLNQEFRLEKDSIAVINSEKLSFKITGFINSPCIEKANCVWSGLKVNYTLTYNETEYTEDDKTPYNVEIINSDYTKYAIIKITKKTN